MECEGRQRIGVVQLQTVEGPGIGLVEHGAGDPGHALQRATVGSGDLHLRDRLRLGEFPGVFDQAVLQPAAHFVRELVDQLLFQDVAQLGGCDFFNRAGGSRCRSGQPPHARGDRDDVIGQADDLAAVVVGLHPRAAFFGQPLAPQHDPQRLVFGRHVLRDLQRMDAEQPVVILQLRGRRRRQAGVAAARLKRFHGHQHSGLGPDRERLAAVAPVEQFDGHLFGVVTLVAVDLDDLVAG